ncbi:MAG: class II glutamine amidotransferase [Myxococcota bacterium]
MCELLGMSALHPTDVNHSVALLRPRGGEIGPHADGWGLAFYEGRAARVFKEPIPAAESRCLAFISEYDFRIGGAWRRGGAGTSRSRGARGR